MVLHFSSHRQCPSRLYSGCDLQYIVDVVRVAHVFGTCGTPNGELDNWRRDARVLPP